MLKPTRLTLASLDDVAASNGIVPYNQGGTGFSSYADGQILIGVTSTGMLAKSALTGTANRVTVTNGAGTITLSGPQDLHAAASPTFAGLTLSGLTQGSIQFAGAGGAIAQDNTGLFWDAAQKRLGVGTGAPSAPIHCFIANGSSAIGIRIGDATTNASLRTASSKFIFLAAATASTGVGMLNVASSGGIFIEERAVGNSLPQNSIGALLPAGWPFIVQSGVSGTARLRVTELGDVVLSGSVLATNAATGFTYLPTCAGTPTGTPGSYAGTVPYIFDTTNNIPYIYNGGWKAGVSAGGNNVFSGTNTFPGTTSISAAGEVSIGVAPVAGIKLYVNDTETATSGSNERALYVFSLINPPSNSSASYNASNIVASIVSANTSNITGTVATINFLTSHSGQGTISNLRGVTGSVTIANTTVGAGITLATIAYAGEFQTSSSASGLVSTAAGVRGSVALTGTGNITTGCAFWGLSNVTGSGTLGNAHVYFVDVPAGTGLITSQHGLYVSNQGRAGITTSYGVRVVAQVGAGTTYALATEGGTVRFAGGDVVMSGAALATNAATGFVYMPTCAGIPTGTPVAYPGTVPWVFDTASNKIWIYSSGVWKSTAALT